MATRRLLLLRHAKSSWDDPASPDKDRPLNERGKRDAADRLRGATEQLAELVGNSTRRVYTTTRAAAGDPLLRTYLGGRAAVGEDSVRVRLRPLTPAPDQGQTVELLDSRGDRRLTLGEPPPRPETEGAAEVLRGVPAVDTLVSGPMRVLGDRVFASRIRKTVRFAEAPVKGMSVLRYDPDGMAAESYRALAKEVLSHG